MCCFLNLDCALKVGEKKLEVCVVSADSNIGLMKIAYILLERLKLGLNVELDSHKNSWLYLRVQE